MYFPNYYVPGILNWTRIAFLFGIILVYNLYLLISAYRRLTSLMERNQYKYFIWSMIGIYVVIFIPNFLVYNIPVDPLWGSLAGVVFAAPFIYGAVKYELFNIQVIAKQAFFFALAVGVVGGIITLFNYSNVWIQQLLPAFPLWVTALISAVLTVTLSVIIWHKIRENEALKYEFLTIIAHKFRTPLTESKWATEELLREEQDPQKLDNLNHIQQSNEKLVNLTGALVDMANTDKNTDSSYRPEKVSLNDLVREAVADFDVRFKEKGILFSAEYPTADIITSVDKERVMFAVQTLLENSRNYTPKGGKVTIVLTQSGHKAIIKVADTGIGIEKEELPRVFSSFYRTKKAQLADTEGFGIGLSLARSIINRHGGKIEVSSEGEGKGSTFTIVLPIG
jgi:signal transduction histidine kinase